MTIDRMRMGDGLQMGLECGHPGKKPGEICELCGQQLEGQQSQERTIEQQAGMEDNKE